MISELILVIVVAALALFGGSIGTRNAKAGVLAHLLFVIGGILYVAAYYGGSL